MTDEGKRLTASVTGLDARGRGVLTAAGLELAFEGLLPGDEVELLETLAGRIELAGLVKPSPHRIKPDCPFHGPCGGCDLLELGEKARLAAKDALLRRTVLGFAGDPPPTFDPFRGSKNLIRYLPRLRLHQGRNPDEKEAGFLPTAHFSGRTPDQDSETDFDESSSDSGMDEGPETLPQRKLQGGSPETPPKVYLRGGVVPVTSCALITKPLNQRLVAARRALAALPLRVDNLVLLAAPEGIDRVTGHVVLAGGDSPRRAREHLWKVMRGANLLGLSAGGPDEGVETVLGSVQIAGLVAPGVEGGPYEAEPAFFSQGNIFQNRVLIEQVVALADLKPGNRVVEGFAGAGNLTLALAEAGAIVEAWESHPGAVRLGIRNVKKSPFADRISLQAGNALKELAKAAPEPDVLVLDPPRSGVPGIGKLVQQLRPRRVVLVSCDMEALARDGRALAGAGFFPRRAVGIDLYPRTHHIEAVVLFTP